LILPDKTPQLRQLIAEIKGPRKQEFEDLHRRFGISHLEVWLIRTVQGPLVMGTFEAESEHALGELGASGEPFALWFNDQISEIFGPYVPDESADPVTEKLLDWRDGSS
jgi:hypothetical protein